MIHIELRQASKLIKEYRSNTFSEYLDLMAAIIQEGQGKGVFRPDIDVQLAKLALFGALDETSRIWLASGADLDKAIAQLTLLFQNALIQQPAP